MSHKIYRSLFVLVFVIGVVAVQGSYSANASQTNVQGATVTIDWTSYPDGSPIPSDTEITNQFQSLGLVFISPPGPPRVLDALGGILISGGPTGFFGEIYMSFVDVGSGLPTSLTVEIIGSGLNISASLEAFDNNGNSLGIVTHTYTGNTGQLSPFTFSAPAGKRIASAIYNGGLNPSAAASIGTLIIHTANPTIEASIDIKPGSETNPINTKSMGTIPVAILSTADFDAPSMVDSTSLTFGKTGDETSLAFCNNEAEDVNEDGLSDLVCHFYTQSTGFQIGDTEGILKGQTVDGISIEGSDSVVVVFASGKNEFVDVCHNPGPDEVTLNVPLSAVDTHAAHGDSIGYPCETIIAQCTDGWMSTFTETEKTYVLEVDKDTLEGRSTHINTVDRIDESLQVTVTSLITGNIWSFNNPSCGSTACGYLFEWYATDPIGEGTGVYKLEITQDQEGLVSLYCAD